MKQRVVQGLTEDACADAAHDITAAAVAAMCTELARELYFNCRWAGDVATSIMISAALASSGCPLPPSNQAITYTGPLFNPQQSHHKLPSHPSSQIKPQTPLTCINNPRRGGGGIVKRCRCSARNLANCAPQPRAPHASHAVRNCCMLFLMPKYLFHAVPQFYTNVSHFASRLLHLFSATINAHARPPHQFNALTRAFHWRAPALPRAHAAASSASAESVRWQPHQMHAWAFCDALFLACELHASCNTCAPTFCNICASHVRSAAPSRGRPRH